MPDYKEVRYERHYLKEPRTERLRKTAAGLSKQLLATGWREVERWYSDNYLTVRYERTGVNPAVGKMPYIPPPVPYRGRGDRGGPGGFRGGPGGFRAGPPPQR